jgi:hypothetical protein
MPAPSFAQAYGDSQELMGDLTGTDRDAINRWLDLF